MKNIIKHNLLAGEKFIPEIQPRFRYNAYYNAFTKHTYIQKIKATGDSR